MLRQNTWEVPFGITAIVNPPDLSRRLQPAAANAHSRMVQRILFALRRSRAVALRAKADGAPADRRSCGGGRSGRSTRRHRADLKACAPGTADAEIPQRLCISAKHRILFLAWTARQVLRHHTDSPRIAGRDRAHRPVRADQQSPGAKAVERHV